MILISLITAALLTGSFGKSTFSCFTECSFNESEETLCFAAAGKSLLFYMLNRNFVDLRLLKDGPSRIFKTVNGLVVIDGPYINRANYFKNGTLKLTNVSKKDDGVYTLEEYASDGKKLRTPIVHLKVLDPVSVLTVSQQCLSPEQKKVNCVFEGDEAELSLTLNDYVLLQSNKHSQVRSSETSERSRVFNVSIVIHEQRLGNIMCKVWNNISRDEAVFTITACNGLQPAAVAALATVVPLLVFAALAATLIKLCKKQKTLAVNPGGAEAEVIYTNVRIKKQTEKTEARQQHRTQQ